MIALFTDFGLQGPYIGQMSAAIYKLAPAVTVINLFADAPSYNSQASGHLLAAYYRDFPAETVFLCVVDPGVGSNARVPVVLRSGDHWFVGPHNGLFDPLLARDEKAAMWLITWNPQRLSASFHGRDLFAPVAARLASKSLPDEWLEPFPIAAKTADHDLNEVIYIDHYGNTMTGIRAATMDSRSGLMAGGVILPRARTFSDAAPGEAFCYENANGLMEIAVNQGSAAKQLGLQVGAAVTIQRQV